MNSIIVYSIGFIAQILFSSRMILQWIISEKNKKVLTPVLFWEISLFASFLLFVYGYFRHDFSIMLGQTITYYIYIRNIQLQNDWKKLHILLRWFVVLFPFFIIGYGYNNNVIDVDFLFKNEKIPQWLLWTGIIGQVLFTLRFVYQWIYSEKKKDSVLPLGFWIISLIGSLIIFIYAIIRKDPVLLAGHAIGLVIYTRNIIIIKKDVKING
ncbi:MULTISPECIES: lipid-A-disaccharide synthase N-terminal domain-containing protein [Flavobacterium]|uniref:lipid-A-disaccharide synthase N-terminal domain-containing protein n=1 Tax=Flavobacterium TaxID=237 RepID=UPI00188D549F|nr:MULTISPECIES: lipid-A-disaccharide synthase N-terminal domain-containing protein [Flavobacterium]MBF4471142.1 lipid-A-disaccharide synthase N-terminal domain-containing protein [Flavobacterium sp. HJJ]